MTETQDLEAIDSEEHSEAAAVPRWALVISWLLTFVGLGISTYLTIAHYTSTSVLACSDTGVVNCAKVTTSAQSYFLGMPVAVLGLCFYAGMILLCSPWAWRSRQPVIHWLRAAGVVSGIGFVLWLVAAELLIIGNICLWCTGVHLVTFALLIVVLPQIPVALARARAARAA